jgi:hypothetical protein
MFKKPNTQSPTKSSTQRRSNASRASGHLRVIVEAIRSVDSPQVPAGKVNIQGVKLNPTG